jgi:hypothetical protein
VTLPAVFKDAPEWGQVVSRLFSGDAPSEIVPPGIILASDRPEWAVLRGETPWHTSRGLAALAANFSSVHITQPAVDRISVVELLAIVNDTAAALGVKVGLVQGAGLTGVTKAAVRDLRRLTVTTSSATIQQTADLLTSVNAMQIPALSTLLLTIPRGWMLSNAKGVAGVSLAIQGNVVNQDVQLGGAWGYERRLRPEEQTLD